jgi:16S rRNA processing protein RimM
VRIGSVRPHAGRLLVCFEGVNDADAARRYAGAVLRAERERVTVGAGEFLDADLAGCEVAGTDGRSYGKVSAIEHYPASDMLVVDGTLVPMVAAIVKQIDVAAKRIVIDPPLDLFPSS